MASISFPAPFNHTQNRTISTPRKKTSSQVANMYGSKAVSCVFSYAIRPNISSWAGENLDTSIQPTEEADMVHG